MQQRQMLEMSRGLGFAIHHVDQHLGRAVGRIVHVDVRVLLHDGDEIHLILVHVGEVAVVIQRTGELDIGPDELADCRAQIAFYIIHALGDPGAVQLNGNGVERHRCLERSEHVLLHLLVRRALDRGSGGEVEKRRRHELDLGFFDERVHPTARPGLRPLVGVDRGLAFETLEARGHVAGDGHQPHGLYGERVYFFMYAAKCDFDGFSHNSAPSRLLKTSVHDGVADRLPREDPQHLGVLHHQGAIDDHIGNTGGRE